MEREDSPPDIMSLSPFSIFCRSRLSSDLLPNVNIIISLSSNPLFAFYPHFLLLYTPIAQYRCHYFSSFTDSRIFLPSVFLSIEDFVRMTSTSLGVLELDCNPHERRKFFLEQFYSCSYNTLIRDDVHSTTIDE